MAYIQDGSSTAGLLAVETASKAARGILYNAAGQPVTRKQGAARDEVSDEGFVLAGVNDGGYRHLRADRAGGLASAMNTMLFTESYDTPALSQTRWLVINSTMTSSVSIAGGHVVNSTNLTTASIGLLNKSLRAFMKMQRAPLHFRARARVVHVNNAVAELGFGDSTAFNGAHTNGAYWQYTAGGSVQPVLTYNGVDITGAPVAGLSAANYYTWDVLLFDDEAKFMVQDTSTGLILAERSIKLPVTQAKMFANSRVFAFYRLFHTASAPASAPQMIVTRVDVVMLDVMTNKPWSHQMAVSGYGLEVSPITLSPTVNWANSAASSNAALSNTAAGYSLMMGRFQFAAVAGLETDYALFGFQVPSHYSLVCTGVEIDTFNMGAAVATTMTALEWWLGFDQSALSLATAGINRTGLGSQSFDIGAAIGKRAERLSVDFNSSPKVTNPGRFQTIILKMPVATATASQIIRGTVNVRGYWE
jgi:hypothetical protein